MVDFSYIGSAFFTLYKYNWQCPDDQMAWRLENARHGLSQMNSTYKDRVLPVHFKVSDTEVRLTQ
jgi:hypothetical protein